MRAKFHETTIDEINRGDFPLHHDTILKVCSDVGYQYFTCSECYVSRICITFLVLKCVKSIEVSSVDFFDDPNSTMIVRRDTLRKISKILYNCE